MWKAMGGMSWGKKGVSFWTCKICDAFYVQTFYDYIQSRGKVGLYLLYHLIFITKQYTSDYYSFQFLKDKAEAYI